MGAISCGPARSAEPVRQPNIVFLLADDLGWSDVGWHGSEIRTPHLDRLANGGAKLEQFYVLPVCSPTRAALLTGRYPIRYGLQTGVIRPWADYGLPLEERTLAQALKEAGYTTTICGKWHLGLHDPAYLPTRRGFDHQYGHYCGAIDYFTHLRDGGFDWHRDDRECRDEGYSTHLLAREAIQTIRGSDAGKPFFLYVPFNAVHTPLQVPEKYTAPYAGLLQQRRLYAGMTAAMDEAIGQIVAALEERKLMERTLILFSSDNGGPVNQGATNGKLRAGKGTLYEGGIRAAAFAHWQGRLKPGTIVDEPLHMVDWYPTLLRLAGAAPNPKLPLDGRDIWACLAEGKPSPHAEILLNAEAHRGALRMGKWKLVLSGLGGVAAEPRIELFDLAADPAEKLNLAEKHPDQVKELRRRYEALAKQAVPARGGPQPKNFKAPRVWGEKE
jgi:arylsulfatase A-like enzyme